MKRWILVLCLVCLAAGAANAVLLAAFLVHEFGSERPLALGTSAAAVLVIVPTFLALVAGAISKRALFGKSFLISFCLLQLLGAAGLGVATYQERVDVRLWVTSLKEPGPVPVVPASEGAVAATPPTSPTTPSASPATAPTNLAAPNPHGVTAEKMEKELDLGPTPQWSKEPIKRARTFEQVDLQCPAGAELRRGPMQSKYPAYLRCEKPLAGDKFHLHGPSVRFHDNGTVSEESTWRDGTRHGPNIFYLPTGERSGESSWELGTEISRMEWYPNGAKRSEVTLRDGKLDGPWMQWREDGSRFRETHLHGSEYLKLSEISKEWWPNGQLRVQKYVPESGPGWQFLWRENGQKFITSEYRDGLPHGLYLSWHENGQLEGRLTYKEGHITGVQEAWYPSGKRKGVWNHDEGFAHGPMTLWDEDGEEHPGEFRDGYEVHR